MTHLFRIIAFLTLTGLTACTEQSSAPNSQEQQSDAFVFTHYSDTTELFVEFSALIVGQSSSFAAHFSKMSDFLPVETGVVTVTLSGGGHPDEQFSIDTVAVAGIFIPKASPRYAGQRQLAIALKSKTLNVKHELGEITVYPDLKAALAVVKDESDDSGDISFLKEQQWKVDFATEVIQQHELQKSVFAFAVIKAAAGNEAYVTAPINGHLLTSAQALPHVGMQVKKGQVLGTLSARLSGVSDIVELELNVQKARTLYQLANNENKRLQSLFKNQAVAKRRVIAAQSKAKIAKAELKAAEKRLKQTQMQTVGSTSGVNIYAPISGTLASVNIASGSYVEEGATLFYIIDPKILWLEMRIAEADIAELQTPERISFKVSGFKEAFQIDLSQTGKLISYAQVIDPISRTLPVIFEFNNEKTNLPAGLLAQARLFTGKKQRAIAVPESALIDNNGQNVVFVHSGGESFQRRVLRLGIKDHGYSQVISGLTEGERVVTTGAYLIHLASSSPAQAGAHGHAH